MEKAKKDRNNANIYSVIDKHYRKKSQREAVEAIWTAGATGLSLTILGVGLCVLIMFIMLVTDKLDSEFFAKYFFLAIALVCVYYLPSRGMRRIDDTAKMSAWTSLFLSIIGTVSVLGIWQLIVCIKAVSKLKDYKPLNQDKLSAKDMIIQNNAISDIIKKTLIMLAIIVGIFIIMGVLSELGKPKSNTTTEYSSSTFNTVYGDGQFSVKLSENASLNTETLAAINSRLSANGVSVSGNLYQDSPFNGYANIQAGCIKYSFAGNIETSLASNDSVKDALDGMKSENTSKGFLVEETARNYSQNGDVYSGVLDTVAIKENTKIFARQKVSVKGNDMCMLAVVAYDTNMLNHVYDDVNNSFVYKW